MEECSNRISECIDRSETYNETRDDLSKNMLRILKELCVAALLMNALSSRGEEVSVQLAWESALLDIETKYLANFYKGLDYIGYRTPEIGQSERLMLKYYDVGEHRFHILYRTNWYFPIRRHPRAFCAPCRQ